MVEKWVRVNLSERQSTRNHFGHIFGFITKGRNSKGQCKIRPNGIKPNFQKAQLNFRPKIKKAESYGRMGVGRVDLRSHALAKVYSAPLNPP